MITTLKRDLGQYFSWQWIAKNYQWLLVILAFAFFMRKTLFNLPILIMAIGGIVLLLKRFSLVKTIPAFQYFILFFMCIWLPMLLSLPDAVDLRTLSGISRVFGFVFVAAFVIYFIGQNNKFLDRIYYVTCALLIFLCIDGLIQFFIGYNLFGFPYDGHRLNGMSWPKYRLGTILSVTAPLLFELARRHGPQYKVAWLVIPLVVTVVLLSATRSSWFMLCMSIFAYSIFMFKLYPWKLVAKVLTVALLVFLVLGYAAYNTEQVKKRFDGASLMLKGDFESIDKATAYRLSLWVTAWNMAVGNPVNGVGVRGYRVAYKHYTGDYDFWMKLKKPIYQTHPHQTFLEVFAETGLIGVLGFLLLWIALIRLIGRIKSDELARVIPWFLVLLVSINPINFHMAFYGNYWSSFYMLIMITALAFSAGNLKTDKAD